MAEPRKVFQIEQTVAARLARRVDGTPESPYHGEIMQALGALQALMAARSALTANRRTGPARKRRRRQ